MIRLRPNTDAWRALDLIVRFPGQLDAEELGIRLWRPAVVPGGVLVARAAQLVNQAPRHRTTVGRVRPPASVVEARAAAPATEAASWSSRASSLVSRLVELGLVEPVRPARLSPDWAERAWSADLPGEGEEPSAELLEELGEAIAAELGVEGRQPSEHAPRLVAALLAGPLPAVVWLGEAPTGARKRAADRLVRGGIVLRSGLRWPTEVGIERIEAGV